MTHASTTSRHAESSLLGKVAIVTGAGSGIGRAIALRFASKGARVVVSDNSGAEVQVASEVGDQGVAFAADVTSSSDVQALISAAVAKWDRVDVLCCAAGITNMPAGLAETDETVFDRTMAVNARGVFLSMKYAIPAMVARGGGSIINIASIGSFVAQPGFCSYYASKGAVLMLTRAAAVDYARSGIRVNAICPGVIETPMNAGCSPEMLEQMRMLHPVGRLGKPDEIAAAAEFLASDECRFATGAAFVIDGARTAT